MSNLPNNQFSEPDIQSLISAPLEATSKAQQEVAEVYKEFIDKVDIDFDMEVKNTDKD